MKITRLLTFRLFLIIAVVYAVGAAIITAVSVQWTQDRFYERLSAYTTQISALIDRSLHYGMLRNDQELISQIVKSINEDAGIERIRVYNKDGVISYSSDTLEIGNRVPTTDEACSSCHQSGSMSVSVSPEKLVREFHTPEGALLYGMITPIRNEPSCWQAPCHAHRREQTVLGVLDVHAPLTELNVMRAEVQQIQTYSQIGMAIVLTIATAVFLWLFVHKPVSKLSKGTAEIIKGNLDYRIRVQRRDEIGELANSFNKMTDEVQRAHVELTEWAETLEQRVEQKTAELKRTQANIVQIEKMASLGKLAATVAHELNNPLEGILNYAKLLKKRFAKTPPPPEIARDVNDELNLIAGEANRCGTIVKNLLLFSRQPAGDIVSADLREAITNSVRLIDHHLDINNIKLSLHLPQTPVSAECNLQQIQQLLLALEMNAVEAMSGGGELRISLRQTNGACTIEISDTGNGILADDLPHIFEPFFSTKKSGTGTGLGLSVAFGIVERHYGTISVESEPQKGTVFTVTLPTTQPANV